MFSNPHVLRIPGCSTAVKIACSWDYSRGRNDTIIDKRNNILVLARLFDCGIVESLVHESSCGYQPTRQPDNVASRSSEEYAAVTLFSCFQQSLRNARTLCCIDDCVSDIELSIPNALTFAGCGSVASLANPSVQVRTFLIDSA